LDNTQQLETGGNTYETVQEFHLYDDQGNILEISSINGVTSSFVWGYNQTYPIAKITNADYATVKIALGGDAGITALQTQDGATLRSSLDVLRTATALAGVQVTSYTYESLVGMTSQTDPNGRTVYYEYDAFGRLKLTRKDDQSIVQKVDYHYKGEGLE
jgi:YD repeat-containing protein